MENRQTPRRTPRKKSKFQVFKEEKLPLIIAGAAALLILIFIIGSISNAVKRKRLNAYDYTPAASSTQQDKTQQVKAALQDAKVAADQYDYEKALEILRPVADQADKHPDLAQALADYRAAKESLVAWDDPAKVPNLSFQMLIADPALAFGDNQYGNALNRNYVTTEEFSKILEQLYGNGYILVSLEDVYTTEADEDGTAAYRANTIYLPVGKKPLMITQTNVNYDKYLVDSNKDGDMTDGRGFANKLMIRNGKPINQMVKPDGTVSEGNFDLVPILEEFIAQHPDFSYRGARAVIAVTGHEGLFGYRTNDKESSTYAQDVQKATETAQWLRDNGYELACHSYENTAYGGKTVSELRADLQKWDAEVADILGETDILVFAQRSDIGDTGSYAGATFEILMGQGFRYYLGFCENGDPWSKATTQYVRQGRIMVAGATMVHHSGWFNGIFDPAAVLDSTRGDVEAW